MKVSSKVMEELTRNFNKYFYVPFGVNISPTVERRNPSIDILQFREIEQ